MKELRWLPEEPKSHAFFFFFLYHTFIDFRYQKVRAMLDMERTTPINQNRYKRNHLYRVGHEIRKISGPKSICQRCHARYKN